MSLSPDLEPHISSHKDVIEDILVSSDPPPILNDFCEFRVTEGLERPSEFDISITNEVEPRDLDKSDDIS